MQPGQAFDRVTFPAVCRIAVGGLPLGFGGGAPLKNAEIDPRMAP